MVSTPANPSPTLGSTPSHHGGPRTIGNDRKSGIPRPVEQRRDVCLALGVGDDIRRHGEVARPGADIVRVRFAVGVTRAAVVIAVAERGQRARRCGPRRGQVQLVDGGAAARRGRA